jgi:hypothetical protein
MEKKIHPSWLKGTFLYIKRRFSLCKTTFEKKTCTKHAKRTVSFRFKNNETCETACFVLCFAKYETKLVSLETLFILYLDSHPNPDLAKMLDPDWGKSGYKNPFKKTVLLLMTKLWLPHNKNVFFYQEWIIGLADFQDISGLKKFKISGLADSRKKN